MAGVGQTLGSVCVVRVREFCVQIDPEAYATLRRHGEEVYPEESCGVLVGRFRDGGCVVVSAIRCENARRDSPRNRYAIDPKELIRIQREARERGWEILGFYHSHPDHPAEWSSTDLAEAHWVGCSYLITAVGSGRAGETRSFRLEGSWDEKRFVEEAVGEEGDIGRAGRKG